MYRRTIFGTCFVFSGAIFFGSVYCLTAVCKPLHSFCSEKFALPSNILPITPAYVCQMSRIGPFVLMPDRMSRVGTGPNRQQSRSLETSMQNLACRYSRFIDGFMLLFLSTISSKICMTNFCSLSLTYSK